MTDAESTTDTLLNGQVKLKQPARGYRVGLDPVLLAAAVAAENGETIADFGTGVGAAALCLTSRDASVRVTGFEISDATATFARENVVTNRVEDRVAIKCLDILDRRQLPEAEFDQLLSNPPFYLEGQGTRSPSAGRERAMRLDADGIAMWVRAGAKVLRQGGYATFIFPADRLEVLLGAMTPRFGGTLIFPLWKQAGGPAKRVIVQGRKGSGAPTQLSPGMALHNVDGSFTEVADAVLRHGRAITLDFQS